MEDYKEVVVYLTQKQAEQANQWIIQRTKASQKNDEIANYIYVNGDNYREWTRNGNLLSWLNAGDLNQEVYPTTHSKSGELVPIENQYIAKINKWVKEYEYLKEESEAEELKDILLKSSGSYQENEWIYSISGTDNGRGAEETRLILDIHDRRLDDPNTTLEIKGNVIIGNTENPEDRKKFTVLGETELQDATGFGRVIDTYGEQNPDQWGHQIPDEAFPKVYINRGEDRFNGEAWADGSYGEGFGTVETTREIVSHTTVNADRGIIIEDGLGDETDKTINKDTEGNFYQNGERVHDTNGAALTINHDGFNVKGHSFIKDEVDKNKFYSQDGVIYSISAENNSEVECTNIEEDCWFCTEENNYQRDNYYENWCIQEDGSIVLITDQWPGFLYHKVNSTRKLIPTSENPKENEKIYVYYGTDGKQYCFTYNAEANTWAQREILNEKPQEVNGYYTISDNYYFYKASISEVKMEVIYVNTQNNLADFDLQEGTFTAKVAERVNPEIKKVYRIKEGYNWVSYPVGNKTRKQVTHEGGAFTLGDYLYWDGIYFRKVENIIDNDFSAGYGSFTIGTSASIGENGEDKIGQHALEVGTSVAAKGKNSVAIGNGTTAEVNNSVVIGDTLTNSTEDSLMIGGKYGDGHALSIHNDTKETTYITHDGSEWLNGNLEVKGTSDLKGITTIGENTTDHGLALEVKHHSQFDEQVKIEKDDSCEESLIVDGKSQFNEDVTLGEGVPAEKRVDRSVDLWVNGEIYNQRIPYEVYDSITIDKEEIPNELADKFFVNSSIATATATYRGGVDFVDYGFEEILPDEENFDEYESLGDVPYPYLGDGESGLSIYVHTTEDNKYYQKKADDFSDKNVAANWLNNNVPTVSIVVNQWDDLPETAEENEIAYVSFDNKYGCFIENEWVEVSEEDIKVCDNNDYLFFQITDKKVQSDLPQEIVLFSDRESSEEDDSENDNNDYPITNIYYRFKFVETKHPTTGAYISGEWKFEYQVNNSGFTQKQWQAINSGISKTWMNGIRLEIDNIEINIDNIEDNIQDIEDDIDNINTALNSKMDKVNPTGTGSFSMNRKEDTTIGIYSTTVGHNNTASGNGSHAEGRDTEATGHNSHAEGKLTIAEQNESHAEGFNTKASGYASHAEGTGTRQDGSNIYVQASGYASHAEGRITTASGSYSHAEGDTTVASGQDSHAEGYKTAASGDYSHAEGVGDNQGDNYAGASGQASHSEGWNTDATGRYSHSEGFDTLASADGSHAEGLYSNATGNGAHAEGNMAQTSSGSYKINLASGEAAHSEGGGTTASGDYSHSEGKVTISSGKYAHAEGDATKASGDASHSEGNQTQAEGPFSHAEGDATTAHGWGAHAEGIQTYAGDNTKLVGHPDNQAAHAEGSQTVAKGRSSHAEGQSTIAEGNSSHAEGYHTIVSSLGGHVSGRYNATHNSTDLFIVGNGTNDENLSNAFLIDTNGNVFIKGRLFVEADENSAHGKEAGKKPNNYTLNESSGIVVTRFTPTQEQNDTVPRTFESLNDKDSYIVFSATNADGVSATYKLDFLGIIGDVGNQTVYYGNYFCRVWTNNFTAPLGTREWQVDFTQ